jgi:hypothetical protein
MRTHRDILSTAGHDRIAELTDRPITTVRSWAQRNSIPATEWRTLIDAKVCTACELIDGVAVRGVMPTAKEGAAA